MNRAVWFAAGAGVGVYAVTKARRVAEVFTPEGLADRLAGLSVGLRIFGEEVRAGAAEKETDLRERLGLALPGGARALDPGRPVDELGARRAGQPDQPQRAPEDPEHADQPDQPDLSRKAPH